MFAKTTENESYSAGFVMWQWQPKNTGGDKVVSALLKRSRPATKSKACRNK